MKFLDFVLARLSEPSTYAGVAALLAAGVRVDDPIWQARFPLVMAGAGFGRGSDVRKKCRTLKQPMLHA